MKIEIDLTEILQDEYGNGESLAESVNRQIVEKLSATLNEGISKRVNAEIATLIDTQLKNIVAEKMPSLVEDLLSAEYREVDKWGEVKKETTTVRKQLVKAIQDQMQYKPSNYDREKNMFTQAVDTAVKEHLSLFKKDYDFKMLDLFQKEAFEYAVNKMSEKLGLSVVKR